MTAMHTQGRLEAADIGDGNYSLVVNKRESILSVDSSRFAYVYEPADARRLAACWNGFEGVETAMVECYTASRDWPLIEQLRTELATVRALLDDAVEAFDEFPAEDHEIADRIRTFLGPKP